MVKNLSAVGNSLGLIIEKPILELLKIEKDTPLEITTDGRSLIITPTGSGRRDRLRAISERMMTEHAETFRKLAL
jgi:antitoxin MazE